MKCPRDGATLLMAERHGIEIDYCPECRGIWLDRGELEKITDRAAQYDPAAPRIPDDYETARRQAESERGRERGLDLEGLGDLLKRRRDDDDEFYRRKKRKKGFLDDLFDF